MNIAVVDSGANLVAFLRMDGAQLGSIPVAEHKARAAAKYRRPTKAFEDAVQKYDFKYILSLDDVVASRGGIPLIEDGKIIGAIGCSGGPGRRMRRSARPARPSSTSNCASAAPTLGRSSIEPVPLLRVVGVLDFEPLGARLVRVGEALRHDALRGRARA